MHISPWTALVLAAFILFSSVQLLLALVSAALCHEWGHIWALHTMGARIEAVRITPFGAQIQVAERPQLSYGREMLAVAAGPAVNLLLAPVLSWGGSRWEVLYAWAGAHLVLGLFNLLPIRPLDGGTLLWLGAAWLREPFAADRIAETVGMAAAVLLAALGVAVLAKAGSPFLLMGVLGLLRTGWMEKRLVKAGKSR